MPVHHFITSTYFGVSIFVPQSAEGQYGKYYAQYNNEIQQLQWYQAVGW